jgi:cation diffusion facilitator CzcD-associated flavoprotein CzcO
MYFVYVFIYVICYIFIYLCIYFYRDQRFCLAPDGDFFNCIKDKKASVVTDTIKEISPSGILLNDSNIELEADVIVMATGLKLQVLSDIEFRVDDVVVDVSSKFIYKGLMINDLPNVMKCLGYTNASWTLKCDLTCNFTTRIINHMDEINCKFISN